MQPRIRAIIALAALLSFWGMLAYDFRETLLPSIQQMVTVFHPIETKTYNSPHFQIQDNAATTEDAIDALIVMLEADYGQISTHTGTELRNPVEIQIQPGNTSATMARSRIILSYNGETIHTALTPAILMMLIRGDGRVRGNLFLTLGYAIYTAEDTGLPMGFEHSSDAWVLLLSGSGKLVPFDAAWGMTFPSPDADDDSYVQAAIQGGSFVRWLIDTHGVEAIERLLDGERLERVTGLFFPDAQREWLLALDMKNLEPVSCPGLAQANTIAHALCPQLE